MAHKIITASVTLFLSVLLAFSVFTEELNTFSITNDVTTTDESLPSTNVSDGTNGPQPQTEEQYYHDVLKSLEPLTPGQIKNIRRELNLLDRAKVSPITEINPIFSIYRRKSKVRRESVQCENTSRMGINTDILRSHWDNHGQFKM